VGTDLTHKEKKESNWAWRGNINRKGPQRKGIQVLDPLKKGMREKDYAE